MAVSNIKLETDLREIKARMKKIMEENTKAAGENAKKKKVLALKD